MIAARVEGRGVWRVVGAPSFGRQDVGYAPGGPIDRFSMCAGNALVGEPPFAEALEIVHASRCAFVRPCTFALAGAPRDATLGGAPVRHGTAHAARPGDTLHLGAAHAGWRTYLCATDAHVDARSLPPYDVLCTWRDPRDRIRVIDGPEAASLRDARAFLDEPWIASAEMNDAGIRLDARGATPLVYDGPEMISAPVADGTVQLTPRGPIVLLRERQTIGGYPRIYTVIDVDVDVLGQYAPRRVVRFTRVTVEDAIDAARARDAALCALRA